MKALLELRRVIRPLQRLSIPRDPSETFAILTTILYYSTTRVVFQPSLRSISNRAILSEYVPTRVALDFVDTCVRSHEY